MTDIAAANAVIFDEGKKALELVRILAQIIKKELCNTINFVIVIRLIQLKPALRSNPTLGKSMNPGAIKIRIR